MTAASRIALLLAGLAMGVGLGEHPPVGQAEASPVKGVRSGSSEAGAAVVAGALQTSGLSAERCGRNPRIGPRPATLERPRDFHFTRAVYSSGLRYGFRSQSWATDFPKADCQFLIVLDKTLDLLDVSPLENAVRLDDPRLRRFPFLYMLEVGYMTLSPEEVEGLRGYLRAGGFLLVDDFWGPYEWQNFEREMRKVFPELPIEEIPLDHPVFHSYYDIQEIIQVPNLGNARRGIRTDEGPGSEVPHVRGIFDDDGHLMAVINWNTDLGDAWEWSEQPVYPFRYSNFAYKMAVNVIVYAMTH